MFDCLDLERYHDYFIPMSKRKHKGVYFYRFVGYNDDILKFLKRFQVLSQDSGIYINHNIQNPTEEKVIYFYGKTGKDFIIDNDFFYIVSKKWLSGISEKNISLFSASLFKVIKYLENNGINFNILKNTYIKLMCWARYMFTEVLTNLGIDNVPKILYEGAITKYELYMLKIMSLCGCDIILVNFDDDNSYLKIDASSSFSKPIYGANKGIPSVHFSKLDLELICKFESIYENIAKVENIVNTNEWIDEKDNFFEKTIINNSNRGPLSSSKIYNIFGQYLGIDIVDKYINRLIDLKQQFIGENKYFVIIDRKINKPNFEEASIVNKFSYTNKKDIIENLALYINTSENLQLNCFSQKAFVETLREEACDNIGIFYNMAMNMLCWCNRYLRDIFKNYNNEKIPVFIYYGICSKQEAIFLSMISKMPIDVIYICPDLKCSDFMENNKQSLILKLENSIDIKELDYYPNLETKARFRVATTAYQAEKELDKLIYTDTGMYRNRQFKRSTPLTLKTTYDEIQILWKEESKYRPSFAIQEERVLIPNIFAKICGVKDEDIANYTRSIKNLITQNTMILTKFPFSIQENIITQYISSFFTSGRINPNNIINHREYKYHYLSDDTQSYIIEKIQELIDLKWIRAENQNIDFVILSTLLNLDKNTIRLIQQFDFTKEIPKLLIVHKDESIFSIEDCIYIAFLNLVGFDIAIFTPTGYKNIERHIKSTVFEQYTIGNFMFDINIPISKPSKVQDFGFFNKLFGKGRV